MPAPRLASGKTMKARFGDYAFVVFLVFSTLFLGILGAPLLLLGRERARAVVRLWIRSLLGAAALLCGVKSEFVGVDKIERGTIIAANHQSQWETLALFAQLKHPIVILKKELLNIPVYGWWLRAMGSIGVDRDGGAKALKEMRNRANTALADGAQLVIFPEGTRVKPGTMVDLQPGIAGIYTKANAAVVPIVHNSGDHWLHPGPAKNPGTITARALPPIEAGLDRRDFLKRLQSQLEAARKDLVHAQKTAETELG